jgi:hypothetical protein
MIVEPDFLDHWKTRMLVRLLKDERAPIYVLRLWAHCQQRKTDRFTDWNPDVLASVCRWETDGLTLWEAMSKTFLEIDGGNVVVHGWAETNASLISAWANGKLGGRPKAVNIEPQKSSGNPPVNPPKTDRQSDRVEKRREDREDSISGEPVREKKAKAPRQRNELLDALVSACGGDPEQTTKAGWSQAATALRDIRQVAPNVTVDVLRQKAEAYRKAHPDWELTTSALAKHWGTLSTAATVQDDWMAAQLRAAYAQPVVTRRPWETD